VQRCQARKSCRPGKIDCSWMMCPARSVFANPSAIYIHNAIFLNRGRGENLCFRFGGTKYLKIRNTEALKLRNTEANWANREIPWPLMWKGPNHGFVERLLTHQNCAHRSINQNWVVNPEWKRQNPGSGWERNHADSKKGGGWVNVRDKTCSKNWDTEKNKNQTSLGISLPMESGQLERWYFHLGASNGISVVRALSFELSKMSTQVGFAVPPSAVMHSHSSYYP